MTTPLGQATGHVQTRCMNIGAKAATTANHGLSGLTAVDGITIIANDFVLVWKQTTTSQNGLYLACTGNWRKVWSFKANTGVSLSTGALIAIYGTASGSQYQKSIFEVTAANTVVQVSGTGGNQYAAVATTANHGLTGLTAIDGYTPSAGDQVLVWKQSTASQNGLYTAAAGAWTKLQGFGASGITAGQIITTLNGTNFGLATFIVTGTNTATPPAAFYT